MSKAFIFQVIRVGRSFVTEGSDIALLKLEKEVKLTEYVHLICLPSTKWVPEGSRCFMHGPQEGVFNHAIETTLEGECDHQEDGSFELCAKQDKSTDECLDSWSGTLVCPDATGKLYAVGLYHSGSGRCNNGKNDGAAMPDKFTEIVSNEARQVIIDVMEQDINSIETLGDEKCDSEEGLLRCPLGTCLVPDQVI